MAKKSRKGLVGRVARAAATPPDFKGRYAELDGQYIFTDSARLYALNEKFEYENKVNGKYNFEALKQQVFNRNYTVDLQIDIADLEAYEKAEKESMKVEKRKITKPYILDAGKFKIGFNAKFLLEFCKTFDTNVVYAYSPNGYIFYQNEENEWGVLNPVRIRQEGIK